MPGNVTLQNQLRNGLGWKRPLRLNPTSTESQSHGVHHRIRCCWLRLATAMPPAQLCQPLPCLCCSRESSGTGSGPRSPHSSGVGSCFCFPVPSSGHPLGWPFPASPFAPGPQRRLGPSSAGAALVAWAKQGSLCQGFSSALPGGAAPSYHPTCSARQGHNEAMENPKPVLGLQLDFPGLHQPSSQSTGSLSATRQPPLRAVL